MSGKRPGKFDVAVVGAGIIGSAVAFELCRSRLRVVVLDRQQPGLEASWAAAGMLAPGAETQDSIPVAPLGRASLELYPEFVAAVERASKRHVGFQQNGGLQVFFGEDAERERDRFVTLHLELGIQAEAISSRKAREMDPALNAAVRAAAFMPQEGRVDNRALSEALLAAAVAQGTEVRTGEAVTGIVMHDGRCAGVKTAAGEVAAHWVVIAAGCFTGGIADVAKYAPTRPVRGQMAALRSENVQLAHVVRSARGYIVPREDGRLICGSTSENAGFEKRVTPAGVQQILSAAVELAPALEDATTVETWSGLRPDTPDHLSVLGPTDVPGLVMATGHYRNGILLTPITAKLVREWIVDGRTKMDTQEFSPLRFKAVPLPMNADTRG